MEKTMSVEDKIKRAEAIYNKKRENQVGNTAKVNINSKKDFKLLKKMAVQILVCLAIYSAFYLVKNNNYIFSEDLINKTKEILSYDVNFPEVYNNAVEKIKSQSTMLQTNEEQKSEENKEANPEGKTDSQNTSEEGIGGAEENAENNNGQDTSNLSQMEQDAINIKNSISFINPIEGTVTSTFGWRTPTTSTVPKYHTGIDIANVSGTVIHSATDGDVALASATGDYRKSFKNSNK